MKPKSPLIEPLILFAGCVVVGVLAWQGKLTSVMGFAWVFAAVCVVFGLLSLRKQPQVAIATRATLVVLGPCVALAGGYAQDRLVQERLDKTQRVVVAALVGESAAELIGVEPVNVDADALRKASSFSTKATIVNFWSRRCSPCLKELPELNEFYRAHREAGLAVVAITTYDEDLSATDRAKEVAKNTRLVSDLGLSFPVGIVGAGDLHRAYMVRAQPSTALIDNTGRIVAYGVGYAGGKQIMEQALALLQD